MRRLDARDRLVIIALMNNAAGRIDIEELRKLGFPVEDLQVIATNSSLMSMLRRVAQAEETRDNLAALQRGTEQSDKYLLPVVLEHGPDDDVPF